MPSITASFKGHQYQIDEAEKLLINGQPIAVEKTKDGKYLSDLLPYGHYDSLSELAEDLIDFSPDYQTIS